MQLNKRRRLRLRERYALRRALAFDVGTDAGEIGVVHRISVPPFEYWPDELTVAASDGARMRVPAATVAEVSTRDGLLLLASSPPDAEPIVAPAERWLSGARAWRITGAAGAAFGMAGFIATFVAVAVDAGVAWGPALAATGVAGAAASGTSWRNAGRSWLGAIGLGSFWLPLAVGAILSLVLVAG